MNCRFRWSHKYEFNKYCYHWPNLRVLYDPRHVSCWCGFCKNTHKFYSISMCLCYRNQGRLSLSKSSYCIYLESWLISLSNKYHKLPMTLIFVINYVFVWNKYQREVNINFKMTTTLKWLMKSYKFCLNGAITYRKIRQTHCHWTSLNNMKQQCPQIVEEHPATQFSQLRKIIFW